MWYHYLLMLLGAYIVLMGIYDLVTNKQAFNRIGWTVWTVTRVVGIIIFYIGYSGLQSSAYVPPAMGGRRR